MITKACYNAEFIAWLQNKGVTKTKEKEELQHNSDHTIILQCRSGRWCRLSDFFNHGYACTVAKMQGGANKCIALYMPGYKMNPFLQRVFGRNHLYTAITRAIKQFTFFGDGPVELKSMIDNILQDNCCLAEFYHLFWNTKEQTPGDGDELQDKINCE